MATSGSSGSPRLVRLSRASLEANAAAIADCLDVQPTDRAVTTLPLHYCYGLSIVHSNLLAGAALVLTDASVTDAGFWTLVREHRATSLHGVPHTFSLLDRVGFADMDLPHLRYLTQAGGRLDPARVRRWASLGDRRGWRFVVMYGATEATARMAYLPPGLAASSPEATGIAIPGGRLRIDDPDDDGVGEIVYAGPNVMLGYAHSPADLAHGRSVTELRTGDLGRLRPDGLLQVTGRLSRFVKPFGVRVDLDATESLLLEQGIAAAVTGDDTRLVVAVENPVAPAPSTTWPPGPARPSPVGCTCPTRSSPRSSSTPSPAAPTASSTTPRSPPCHPTPRPPRSVRPAACWPGCAPSRRGDPPRPPSARSSRGPSPGSRSTTAPRSSTSAGTP